jgi:lipoprotein-releasing system permease protein
MRFETFVALRYLRGKRKSRFVGLITLISVAGVSVGVIALIVVMSVMTGFDNALRATIIGNRAHLTVERPGAAMSDINAEIQKIKEAAPEVVAAGPITQVEALIRNAEGRQNVSGGFVVGIDPELEQSVTKLSDNLTRTEGRDFGEGNLPGKKEIVLGYRLAMNIGARIGSEVSVMTMRQFTTSPLMTGSRGVFLTVSGISQAKMSDFDTYYAFVNLDTASMLSGRPGADAIHCKLTDPFLAEAVARRLEVKLGVAATTWYESQQAYFAALEQEKVAMFIILVFIVLVAAFNITSTLIMVVMEKRQDIGILRTLGVSSRSILLIFITEGLSIGVGGTILGVVAGTLLAQQLNPVAKFIAWMLNVDLFNSQIYYFDRIPVAVVPFDIGVITVSAIVLTFVSTLYPAWSAARLDPIEALRYE